MSLFDLNDPQSVGLLSLGLRLMSTPGGLGQALGQSGLGAMSDVRATQQASQQQQMAKLAFERAQMERDQAAESQRRQKLIEQAAQLAMVSPQQKATATNPALIESAMGNPEFGGSSASEAAAAGPQFNQGDFIKRLMSIDPLEGIKQQAALQKQQLQPVKLGAGETLLDPVTFRQLANNPKADAEDTFIRFLKQSGIDPASPQGQKLIQARMQKETTHAPAATAISYGSPVPVMLGDGSIGYAQPGNREGAKPQLMTGPSGAPMKKPPDVKQDPVEFNKSVAGLNELKNGLDSYEKTLKSNSGSSPIALGKRRAALQGAYTSLQMGLKNAFELGALAGPDLSLLNNMLVDPTSPQALLLGDKGVAEQISQARQYLKNRGAAVYKAHKKEIPGEYLDSSGGSDVRSQADSILQGK